MVHPRMAHSRSADADSGAVAQLGERFNGIEEVRGSIPLSSTDVDVRECGRGSAVERLLAKEKVVGSNPIARSRDDRAGIPSVSPPR